MDCKKCHARSAFGIEPCKECKVVKSAKNEKPYWIRLAEQAGLL